MPHVSVIRLYYFASGFGFRGVVPRVKNRFLFRISDQQKIIIFLVPFLIIGYVLKLLFLPDLTAWNEREKSSHRKYEKQFQFISNQRFSTRWTTTRQPYPEKRIPSIYNFKLYIIPNIKIFNLFSALMARIMSK